MGRQEGLYLFILLSYVFCLIMLHVNRTKIGEECSTLTIHHDKD